MLELPPPGPAAADKSRHRLNGRIVEDHLRKLLLLDLHRVKADVLGGARLPAHAARILLRKKAEGHNGEEVNIQCDGADHHAQNQDLMAQNPAQADGVLVAQPIKGALAGAIDGSVAALVARLEEARAEHRRGGQRNQQRDSDGHAERDGELAEELADDAAHQQNRNEDGNQRKAHRDHGEADLLGTFHRRIVRRFAHFKVAGDVLDDHDGVVHDKAGGDGEGHQREVVDGIAQQPHDAEGAQQRERHGDGGNDGGPDLAQKEEDDQNNQADADDERDFYVAHAGANGRCPVHGHVDLDGGRDGGLQARHLAHHTIHGGDNVGAGNLEDDDQDASFNWPGPLVLIPLTPALRMSETLSVTVPRSPTRTGAPV
jgi:hypothetical protein